SSPFERPLIRSDRATMLHHHQDCLWPCWTQIIGWGTLLAMAATLCPASLKKGSTAMPGTLPSASVAQFPRPEEVMCGPNSLYMLLQEYNRPATPQAVMKYLPAHTGGMSLHELRAACEDLSLPAEVRLLRLEDLQKHFESPLIAHWSGANDQQGHYVVVVAVQNGQVKYRDGTTGETKHLSSEDFAHFWSG